MSKMVVVLTEGYADWESALLAAAVRSYYGVTVLTASPDGDEVMSMGGFRVTPDMAIADIVPEDIDVLVVNGGATWEGHAAPDISAQLTKMHALGKPVAAICAAVRALAHAGLLDAVRHTGNSTEELAGVANYHGSANFVAQPSAVLDQNVITAPGTAPVSFMKSICDALGFGGSQLDYYIGLYAAEHAT